MTKTSLKATCVVCSQEKEAEHSLRLEKDDKGYWKPQPVCGDCRKGLIAEAVSAGKFIRFFTLEGSTQEAEKRNKNLLNFRRVLGKFGSDREDNGKDRKSRPGLKVAKS